MILETYDNYSLNLEYCLVQIVFWTNYKLNLVINELFVIMNCLS